MASGDSMISEGHKTAAEGWRMFEEAVDESMHGDLPQILRQLKEKNYADATPIAHGHWPSNSTEPTSSSNAVTSKKGGGSKNEEPVIVMILGHRNWACSQCNTVRGSRNGCDAHIRQAHTGKALVCSFCSFSTYNMDLLMRHKKEHK